MKVFKYILILLLVSLISGYFLLQNHSVQNRLFENTVRELFQADLLKKSEQLPVDQEQLMLLEDLYKTVEKLDANQEQNMTNKVNIQFLREQLDKALHDIEKLKDKQREFANGNGQKH